MLLKFRLRSEKELAERLKKKKFAENIIQETIGFLKERGFLDDEAFARAWFESRLRRPLGLRRLERELETKGIDKEIIQQQIGEVKKGYSEEEIVRDLAKARLKKLKDIEPQKARVRIFGYLIRRGFSTDIIIDVLNQPKTRS